MLWEGWIDRDVHRRAHQRASTRCKAIGARLHAARGGAGLRHRARTTSCTAARWFARRRRRRRCRCTARASTSRRSGTAKNAALINLHLATGQIGKPGAGPFSLTGQPNAMGGREVGGLANLLSGASRPRQPRAPRRGRGAVGRRRRAGEAGQDRGRDVRGRAPTARSRLLWIACTNPAQSMPDQATVRARARSAPSSSWCRRPSPTTATCAFADVLLPATTWGEKDGTVTNTERRITRVRAAVPRAGRGARTTGRSRVDFARRLEARAARPRTARAATLLPVRVAPKRVWNEHREADARPRPRHHRPVVRDARAQRPAAVAVSRRRRRAAARACTTTAFRHRRRPRALRRRAVRAGRRAARRALSVRAHHRPPARPVARHEPHRHAGPPVRPRRRAGRSRCTRRTWRGAALKPGDLVHVTSRRGSIVLPVQASDAMAPRQAFIAMHWGGEFLSGIGASGRAAGRRQRADHRRVLPELEAARAQARGGEDPEGRTAVDAAGARLAAAGAAPWRAPRLRALMPRFPTPRCVPFGHERRAPACCSAPPHEAPPADGAGAHRSAARPGRRAGAALRRSRRGQRRTMRLDGGSGERCACGRSCWPATPRRGLAARAAGTTSRRRPTAAGCCPPAPRRRGALPRAAAGVQLPRRRRAADPRGAGQRDGIARRAAAALQRRCAAAPSAARACPSSGRWSPKRRPPDAPPPAPQCPPAIVAPGFDRCFGAAVGAAP